MEEAFRKEVDENLLNVSNLLSVIEAANRYMILEPARDHELTITGIQQVITTIRGYIESLID